MLGKSQSQQRMAAAAVVAVVLSVGVGRSAAPLPSEELPAPAAERLVGEHWQTGKKQNLQNLKGVRFQTICENV
jgi:hypothetical protein